MAAAAPRRHSVCLPLQRIASPLRPAPESTPWRRAPRNYSEIFRRCKQPLTTASLQGSGRLRCVDRDPPHFLLCKNLPAKQSTWLPSPPSRRSTRRCTPRDSRPGESTLCPSPRHSPATPQTVPSEKNCSCGSAAENLPVPLHKWKKGNSRRYHRGAAAPICCKRSKVRIFKRRFQDSRIRRRGHIRNYARVNTVASMCRAADQVLLPERGQFAAWYHQLPDFSGH